jgi:diketogulonate reductase-like aldo/keto reductase
LPLLGLDYLAAIGDTRKVMKQVLASAVFEQVVEVAAAHNVSSAQVGLKWIVQQGLPLTTAVWRLDYMLEDLDLWTFNLTSVEMEALSAVANHSALQG